MSWTAFPVEPTRKYPRHQLSYLSYWQFLAIADWWSWNTTKSSYVYLITIFIFLIFLFNDSWFYFSLLFTFFVVSIGIETVSVATVSVVASIVTSALFTSSLDFEAYREAQSATPITIRSFFIFDFILCSSIFGCKYNQNYIIIQIYKEK